VGKTFVKTRQYARKLIIKPQFDIQLAEILEFGIEQFGAKAAYDLYSEIMNKIIRLSAMPDIYPKNRFIESTAGKTYRNILAGKYSILYSITTTTITIITIYHQSINPQKIRIK